VIDCRGGSGWPYLSNKRKSVPIGSPMVKYPTFIGAARALTCEKSQFRRREEGCSLTDQIKPNLLAIKAVKKRTIHPFHALGMNPVAMPAPIQPERLSHRHVAG